MSISAEKLGEMERIAKEKELARECFKQIDAGTASARDYLKDKGITGNLIGGVHSIWINGKPYERIDCKED